MKYLKFYLLFLLIIGFSLFTCAQDFLFWTFNNSNTLNRTSVSTKKTDNILVRNGFRDCNISVNPSDNSLLIKDGVGMKRFDFNGLLIDSIPASNNNFSCHFELDIDSSIIYYLNSSNAQFRSYRIKDSVIRVLIPRIVSTTFKIDEINRRLYIHQNDNSNSRLIRFDLPSLSNQKIIYTSPTDEKIDGFFLSPKNSSIYFINRMKNAIQRIDYDGNNLETIHSETTNKVKFIEGGYCSNKIYFVTSEFTSTKLNYKIKQIDFKGMNEKTILDTNNVVINSFGAYIFSPKESAKKDTSFCLGDSIILNYSASNTTYLWNDGNLLSKRIIKQPGVYWVDISTENCTVRDSIVVSAYSFTESNFIGKDTTICQGDSITINASLPGFNYLWSNGSTLPELTIKDEGTYYLQISDGSCPLRDSISVLLKPSPNFTLGRDTVLCEGDSLKPINIQGNYQYLWNTGLNTESIVSKKTGTYWLIASENGCFITDSIDVTVKSKPVFNLGKDTSICVGDSVILNATTTNATYSWSNEDSSATIKVGSTANYKVIVTLNGCSSKDSTFVIVLDNELLFIGNDTSICLDDEITVRSDIPNSNYLWQDGSIGNKYVINRAGQYFLNISNQCGSNSDTITIKTKDCNCYPLIPTVFTPNNDLVNDQFIVRISCEVEDYSLEIYNRWGEKVFTSVQHKQAWDGTVDGRNLKVGAYYYVLRYKGQDESLQTLKGSILLSR